MIGKIIAALFLIWNLPWLLVLLLASPFIKGRSDAQILQDQYESERANNQFSKH